LDGLGHDFAFESVRIDLMGQAMRFKAFDA
jgi:hypothetical protein